MPSQAEYLLGALLLAAQLVGDVRESKAWAQAATSVGSRSRAPWRKALKDSYNLRRGDQMDRVQHLFQRLSGMEIAAGEIETFCTQMSKGKGKRWWG